MNKYKTNNQEINQNNQEKNKETLYNPANLITLSRIVLGFVFLGIFILDRFFFLNGGLNSFYMNVLSFVVFLIAIITDGLDGFVARKLNIVSDFGKHFDPIADSIFFIIVFATFVYIGLMPVVFLLIVMVREGVMHLYMRPFSKIKGFSLPANIFGKLKTVFQSVFSLVVIALMIALKGERIKIFSFEAISSVLFALIVLFSVLSLTTYIPIFIKNIRGGK